MKINELHSITEIKPEHCYQTRGSRPVRALCNDLNYYVCKYHTSSGFPYHLFNEYLAACFLQIWQLPVPEFAFVKIKKEDKSLRVEIKDIGDKHQKAMQGTTIRLIENMIKGVTKFFEKRLQLIGVGFNAKVEKENLVLNIGFSHPVKFLIPKGIKIEVEKNTLVVIKGVDKQLVGNTAAKIRQLRKPDVYRGKGIKYEDEEIRKKAVKKMVATTA